MDRMRGAALVAGFLLAGWTVQTGAQDVPPDDPEARLQQLDRRMQEMAEELKNLKRAKSDGDEPADPASSGTGEKKPSDAGSWSDRLHLGGYGEMHANFGEGSAPDLFDIHRLVLYLGYDFADWIRFHSETEIEHAYVSSGAGGDLVLEQAHFDFLLMDACNVRLGRILTPLGITNKKHEPPTFNGVERPLFDTYIIPTTWSSDGVGLFGSLTSSLDYEVYVVGGLDGSRFDATDGIRGGRIKERPGLHEPAVTGRLDFHPFGRLPGPLDQTLRVGFSAYFGGLDNGNKGVNPDIDGDIQIYSGDIEYSIWRFDLRGAVAYEAIEGADAIGSGTASDILGWYLEGACHVWPDAWKTGLLERSDALVFVRYEDVNTQYRMPGGVASDPAGNRDVWVLGLGFLPTPDVVIKADYQHRDDASSRNLPGAFNLGIGFRF